VEWVWLNEEHTPPQLPSIKELTDNLE
jgi:hypothetical protein